MYYTAHAAHSYLKILNQIIKIIRRMGIDPDRQLHEVYLHVGFVPTPWTVRSGYSTYVFYIDLPSIWVGHASYLKMLSRYRPYIIVNSNYCADLMERYLKVVPDMVVPHGIDPEFVIYGSIEKTIDVLYVASSVPRKRIERLDEIAVKLPDKCFVIFGDRECRLKHVDVIARRGEMSELDMSRLYARSRIYISVSAHECFHMPVIEAACNGAIPLVPRVPPYIEHDVPFKVMYDAELDISRLEKNPDGKYPVMYPNIDDVVDKILKILERYEKPSDEAVRYVIDRYSIYRVYKPIIEVIFRR